MLKTHSEVFAVGDKVWFRTPEETNESESAHLIGGYGPDPFEVISVRINSATKCCLCGREMTEDSFCPYPEGHRSVEEMSAHPQNISVAKDGEPIRSNFDPNGIHTFSGFWFKKSAN